jgi:phosphate-selective porin OprO/OprP
MILLKSYSLFLFCFFQLASSNSYADGIEYHDEQGRFAGNFRFRIQNLAEFGQNANTWQVRRLRLRSKGWVADPKIKYSLQLSFTRQDMDWEVSQFPNVVRDAVISYEFAKWVEVGFGQTKLAGNRQRVVSSGQQQFADRSVVNRQFNIDRDFGFFTTFYPFENRSLIASVNVTTGEGRNLPVASNSGLAHNLKLEWQPLGAFKNGGDYFEGDLEQEPDLRAAFAISYAHFRDSNRQNGTIGRFFNSATGSPVRRTLDTLFLDGLLKWRGYSFYFEGVSRDVENPILSSTQAYYPGYGLLFQAGKMISEKNEIAVRWAWVTPKSSVQAVQDSNLLDQQVTTVGFNHYVMNHRVKIQADVGHEINKTFFNSRTRVGMNGRFNVELGI